MPVPSTPRSVFRPRAFLAAHAKLAWALGLGLAAVIALYLGFGRDPASAQAAGERARVQDLVQSLWASTPDRDFTGLSTTLAIERHQVPGGMLRATGAPVRSAWGTPVDLLPHGVRGAADGFIVRYRNLPPLACSDLVTALGDMAYDIRVDLRPVMGVSGPEPDLVQRTCAGDGATVDFVFHPDLIPGTALPRHG